VPDVLAQDLQSPVAVDIDEHDVEPVLDNLQVQRLAVETEHFPLRDATSPAGAIRHDPGVCGLDPNGRDGTRDVVAELMPRHLAPAVAAALEDQDPHPPRRDLRLGVDDRGPEGAPAEEIAQEGDVSPTRKTRIVVSTCRIRSACNAACVKQPPRPPAMAPTATDRRPPRPSQWHAPSVAWRRPAPYRG
jgi:hypothetical protein